MYSLLNKQWYRLALGASLLTAVVNTAVAINTGSLPYVDICGTVKVNGQPTQNVLVEAIRCSDNVVIVSDTTDAGATLNFHVVFVAAYDPALVPAYVFGGVGYTPIEVYLKFSINGCTKIISCADVAAGYRGTTDGKLNVDVDFQCGGPGTGTPGYWKNHPDAWPVQKITIGGISYSKADAIKFMSLAEKGDKTKTVFRHLISAKLNVIIGNASDCIADEIMLADAWMAVHPVCSGVSGSSAAWAAISGTATELDDYNNGRLCAPHRD